MQAILLCCQLLLDPGDNIVIVSPIWPNITSADAAGARRAQIRGARPQARTAAGRSTCRRCSTRSTTRTRAIFVNSPGNPTGWTMTSDEQRALLDFARKRGVWIMADEVYARLIYTRPVAPSFLELAGPDDPLLVLNSFSKPWAMTGWRHGLADPSARRSATSSPSWCRSTPRACRPSCSAARSRRSRRAMVSSSRDGRALPRRRRAGVPAPVGPCRGSRSRGRKRPSTTSSRSTASTTPWPSARSWRRNTRSAWRRARPSARAGRAMCGCASPRVQSG